MGPIRTSIVRFPAPDRRESQPTIACRPRRGSSFWNHSSLRGMLEACPRP
jgi:hypothetical protein